jgi:hypothetical protein
MAIKNFSTALYIMRLNKEDSKYDGLLKIGISNNIDRRKKEIGSVELEYAEDYRTPRALVMATEMLAQAYAYFKVGRPQNYRQVLPVQSGSSEFFNTTNIRQARGFVIAARTRVNYDVFDPEAFFTEVQRVIQYVKDIFKRHGKRLPKSFRMEVVRINQILSQEKATI